MSLVKFIEEPQFEDYKEVFKDNYILERREDGVILARAHTNGGPIKLSVENHKSVQQLFKTIGADNKNEIMSRGENEHVVNPLQKVVEQLFMICQIKGVKKILLFTPEQQSLLYPNVVNPHVSKANFWTDPLFKFPLLQNTNYIEIIAYPGHMVYIPKDWWWTSINMEETFTTYIK